MATLYNRTLELQIGTTIVTDHDARFEVSKSLRKQPNSCALTIYNLEPTVRAALASTPDQVVTVRAGYKGREAPGDDLSFLDAQPTTPPLLFLGDVRLAHSTYLAPDWETVIEAGDGEKRVRKSRINRTFAPGTDVRKVLTEVAKAMKIDLGNAAKRALASGSLTGAGAEFLNGVTVSGNAYRELEKLVRSTGGELSVQDGAIQILDRGAALREFSVVLSADTGLVGEPTVGDKGIVSFRSLLNGDLSPGRQVELSSRSLTGRYVVRKVTHKGDTTAQDWYSDCEAREL